MKESTFRQVTQPTLLLYYYKDDEPQDNVVKVSAMKRMIEQLGTPFNLKRQVAIPNAGDHVIASYVNQKDIPTVKFECEKFAVTILQLKERNNIPGQ